MNTSQSGACSEPVSRVGAQPDDSEQDHAGRGERQSPSPAMPGESREAGTEPASRDERDKYEPL